MAEALAGTAPGQSVTITYRRAGQQRDADVVLGSSPDRPQGLLGVRPGVEPQAGDIRISLGDIGGPSAGLMFALAVVDKLTPGELTGGRFVAGTGTITPDGGVGPIGGIPFKMRAARDAGATEFLVPADNCAEAVANAPDGLQLLRVGTLRRRGGRSGRNPDEPPADALLRPERELHTAAVELWGQGVPSDRPPEFWAPVLRAPGRRRVGPRRAPAAKPRIHGACAVAMRPPVGAPTLTRRTRILLVVAAILVLLLLGGARLINFYVDWLWFGEVGYRDVFTTVLFTRIVQFLVGGLLIGGLVALSLWIAYRSRPVFVPVTGPEDPIARYRTLIIQRLRLFAIGIPVVIGVVAGLRGAGRLADRPAVRELHAVRRHRPRVRHRRRLLRLPAARSTGTCWTGCSSPSRSASGSR